MEPVFKRTKTGVLSLADSSEAIAVRGEHRERAYCAANPASMVRSRAETAVRRLNGDINNKSHLLGQFTIQFGQFRDETFQWLATNALGYAAYLVASSAKDPKAADARWVNKMALKNYLSLFPEGLEAIDRKKNEKQVPVKVPVQPVAAAVDVLSDTEDQELSAMAEKIEQDLAASQSVSTKTTPVVEHSPCSDDHSSGEKSTGSAQKKKQVRSVSGAAMKTVRSLFLEQSTSSASDLSRPAATSSTPSVQFMTLTPVKKGQTSSASQVPLIKKWRTSLPPVDHSWVSSALYYKDHLGDSRFDFSRISGSWLYPPQPPHIPQSIPKLHHFFGQRVFIWMPVKLWSLQIACPHPECNNQELSFGGVYPVVRQVLDVSSCYNLVSETLWCKRCKRKMVSWSYRILSQIDVGHRSVFPCLLTTMKACDFKVAILMRQRGLGNSASQVQKKLQEEHSTEWYKKTIQYMSACKSLKTAASSGLIEHPTFQEPPAMTPVPQYRWLMQVYIQDVLQRLDEVKANITSVFGRILKVDSTKKVTKKLTGATARTAEWATNVGNEYGQVLMSVMTSGEGRFGLHRMAKGLMKRFSDANQPPPEVVYVDRDCCGRSTILNLFDEWQDVEVRLDVWHFMRRLSAGCHTDSHPLYGLFMKKLSQCIFAWDNDDLQCLKAAKRSELLAKHVLCPSEDVIMKSITKNELALHCRRETRGVEETIQLIDELIKAFDGDKGKDTLGVPLINSRRMREEWEAQQRHVTCLQDPQGVQLYIQTGSLKKGGKELPTYRCCRGSTSLESFHLHLNRFIPGTLANDTVFQAYLVDGLSRWNQDRSTTATGIKEPQSYSGLLRFTANKLTEEVFGKKISSYIPPGNYTGELIGLEYLYDQTGRPLQEYDAAIQLMEDTGVDVMGPEEDEGFVERESEDFTISELIVEREDILDNREQSEPLLEPSPVTRTKKEQSKPRAPVVEQPVVATKDREQSEPLLEPSPVTRTKKEQSRPRAPVIEQPLVATKDREQSEPLLEPSPVTRTNKEQSKPRAPVIEQPLAAEKGDQFDPVPQLCPVTKKQILPYLTDAEEKELHTTHEYDDSVGPDNISGYGRVQALAAYLVKLQSDDLFLSASQAEDVVRLWNSLNDFDKRPILFAQVFTKESRGRFRAKRHAAPGVESTERSMMGPDSVPAARPDCNRYVEALVHRLSMTFPGSRRREGQVWSRWSLILEAYSKIRTTIFNTASVMERTNLQLPEISQKTLKAWHNDKAREQSRQVLYQGIRLPEASLTASRPLPLPKKSPVTLPRGDGEPFLFNLPTDTTGTVQHQVRRRRLSQPVASPQLQNVDLLHATEPIFFATPLNPTTKTTTATTTATTSAPITDSLLSSVSVPYTTVRYRKRKAEEEAMGQHRRTYNKKKVNKTCKKCGQIIEKTSHVNYFGNLYCQNSEMRSFEEWKEQFISRNYGKKKER